MSLNPDLSKSNADEVDITVAKLMALFPDEAFYHIFPRFDPRGIESAEKTWRSIINMPFLWQRLIRECFPSLVHNSKFHSAPRELFIEQYSYFDDRICGHEFYENLRPLLLPALKGNLSELTRDLGPVAEVLYRISAANGHDNAVVALLHQRFAKTLPRYKKIKPFLSESLSFALPDYDKLQLKTRDVAGDEYDFKTIKLSGEDKAILTISSAVLGCKPAFDKLNAGDKVQAFCLAAEYGQTLACDMMLKAHPFPVESLRQSLMISATHRHLLVFDILMLRLRNAMNEQTKGFCLSQATWNGDYAVFDRIYAQYHPGVQQRKRWELFRNLKNTLYCFDQDRSDFAIYTQAPGDLLYWAAFYDQPVEFKYLLEHAKDEITYTQVKAALDEIDDVALVRSLSSHPVVVAIWERDHPYQAQLGHMMTSGLERLRTLFSLDLPPGAILLGGEPSPRVDEILPAFAAMRLTTTKQADNKDALQLYERMQF